MNEQIVETWTIHNRIMVYMLDAIASDTLMLKPQPRGRSTGETYAHVHNVRLMWLQQGAPDLMETVQKIEKESAFDKEILTTGLTASGDAIGIMVQRALAANKRIRGFKPHAVAFIGYLISHESHHRGQIVLQLKQAGIPLDKKILYGLWEWGVR